ncbi:DUF3047 domain-containing protein [Methylomonas sp. AM2-LC]|uniref:DUF3047 domain-containing protein n=1 Tax=Methylomonas sp. AM2-LC TaxID=3153301 RepID=UPI003263686E
MKKLCILLFTVLASPFCMADTHTETKLVIGEFSNKQMEGWDRKIALGETQYQLDTLGDVTVLKANSKNSASGLFKEQRVDLDETPILNWSWRITNRLNGLIEQTKEGDDYAARLYVIVNGGVAFWESKAINYVWSSSANKETVWPNAYSGKQLMMLALRGPEAEPNIWLNEKRNVRADLKKLYGEDIRYIDAVAVMSDSDDSHSQVTAYYGDIWFSKH